MRKRILAIAPHSDDAELGLGGYIHREAEAGASVKVVVLAGGSMQSTFCKRQIGVVTRRTEGQAARDVLGIDEYAFAEIAPDASFNTVPRAELVAAIEDLILDQDVDELFIPLPSFHEDHAVTWHACIAALRPQLNRRFPRAVYAYEYPGHSWGPTNEHTGRVYAPLDDDDLEAKLGSLAQHKSQWVSFKASLYGERGVRALAELRGAEIGVKAAECFFLLRAVMA